MDLREPPPPTPPPQTQTPPQQLQPPHAPTPLQSQPNMILGPTSSYPTTASPHLINNLSISPQNAAVGGGFPFNAMSAQRLQSKPEGALDGSSPTSSSGMGVTLPLGLSPTTISAGLADSGGGAGSGVDVASEHPSKKHRGRPPGSGKKQLDALGGTGGVGFTPHVITVKEGECFFNQSPRCTKAMTK
ncbi:hypothetical protein OIU76_018145 [Salix suchowensis]|nr:hypothetical protein OIU76_018145 [Salix suchowensis]